MTVEARWPLAVGLACNLVALALDAWVWLVWQDHVHESTLVPAVIVASNSLLGAFACVEVVRRRRGWRSPLFWVLLLLSVTATYLTWEAWRRAALVAWV
jgi:hypothetical protein